MTTRFNPYQIDVPRMLSELKIDAEHRGDGWVARCPSGRHQDSKPSWTIKDIPGEPKHGCHWCFSCQFGGTAAELVSHVVGITLQGAYGWICERAMGANLAERVQAVRVVMRPLVRSTLVPPDGVVFAPLEEWPTAPARYALDRGITAWQVARWGIGYATEGRLAGRIILPARGADGSIHNYTARTFVNSPARYISAKTDEGVVPGAVFGEQHWPAVGDRSVVVVTEGGLNALAVERVSRLPFGSLFGSLVTLAHIAKLATFRTALVFTDPDLAGDRAAEKLMGALARHVRQVRVDLPRVPAQKVDANSVAPDVLKRALEDAAAQIVRW